jgi:hypothetical protein
MGMPLGPGVLMVISVWADPALAANAAARIATAQIVRMAVTRAGDLGCHYRAGRPTGNGLARCQPRRVLLHQRDHVGDALCAVGAELVPEIERLERGGDVHRRDFAAGLSWTAESTSATMPLVIAALLSARKCSLPSCSVG